MQSNRLHRPALIAAALCASTALATDGTATFQQGLNGYTGQTNVLISTMTPDSPDATAATRTNLPLDGLNAANPDGNNGGSPDAQGLIKFNNLFGSAAGQIPAGAFILSASLTVTTYTGSNSQSGGPYAVAAIKQAWDPTTVTYNSFVTNASDTLGSGGNVGPYYTTGTTTRPIGGIGATAVDTAYSYNVTNFVRGWSDGSLANNGVAIQSGFVGSTDGWTIDSAKNTTVSKRPQLSVSYTTDPVTVTKLQQGVNGYTGGQMKFLQQFQGSDLTTDGNAVAQDFLDAEDAGTPEARAAIKFGDLAASANIPANATIRSAYLVVTTGDTSKDSRSPGTWELDQLTSPLTDDSTFTSLSDTSVKLGSITGMTAGSQAYFDVTSYIAAVLAGGADNGWLLRTAGTTDGWQINFNGADDASTRPQLVIAYSTPVGTPEPASLAVLGLAGMGLVRRRRR